MAILAELKSAAEVATRERAQAEERERQALFAHESAKSQAAQSARRRLELAEALAAAETLEAAEMDRLGQSRLALAALEREIESYADKAAKGDLNAPKTIVRLNDSAELNRAMVVAHGRRVAAATRAKDAAERALAAHDAAAATADQLGREALLVQVAELVDRNLEAAGSAAVGFVSILADARRAHIPTAWAVAWGSNDAMAQFLKAAHHFGDRLEHGHAATGGGGRLYWTWSRFAQDFLATWAAARQRPSEPALEAEPAEAA